MVRVAPGSSGPTEHGKAVAQSPAFERKARPSGVGSTTWTTAADAGPAFRTAMVQVMLVPRRTVSGQVLVIERSAGSVSAVESDPSSLSRLGSLVPSGGLTRALLTSTPVALSDTTPVAVYVAMVPGCRSTVVSIAPAPPASPQLAPGPATQVQVTPVRAAGKVSMTDAPTASLGPAL